MQTHVPALALAGACLILVLSLGLLLALLALRRRPRGAEAFAAASPDALVVLSPQGALGLDLAQNARNCRVRTADGRTYQMETPGLARPPEGAGFNGCVIAAADHPLLAAPEGWKQGDPAPCSAPGMLSAGGGAWPAGAVVHARDDLPPGTVTCAIEFDAGQPPALEEVRALDRALRDRAVRVSPAYVQDVRALERELSAARTKEAEHAQAADKAGREAEERVREGERAAAVAKNDARAAAARAQRAAQDAEQAWQSCEAREKLSRERFDKLVKACNKLGAQVVREAAVLERIYKQRRMPANLFPPVFREALAYARRKGVIK